MSYEPGKERKLSAIRVKETNAQADFSYAILGNVIAIIDLNLGKRSVTNDIEAVLRRIEYYHQGSIATYQIMYRDSEETWDGIHWDGKHASFFALREKDETKARKKLLNQKNASP